MLSQSSHRSPLRRRARTAGIAGLCVVAHLFALMHLAVVQHERCPEHGELVHAKDSDHATGRVTAAVAPGATATPTDAVLPAYAGSQDRDHDHCLSVTERRDRQEVRAQAATSMPLDRQPSLPDAAAPTIARALYRSAPKTSPPQHA